MEAFDLKEGLRPFVAKVIHSGSPVSFSGGNKSALLKWLVNMNNRQPNKLILNDDAARKYPLIWLSETWLQQKNVPGWRFNNCEFYISTNSTVAKTNENRVPEFAILYEITNGFLSQLRRSGLKVVPDSISIEERPNFNENEQNKTIDVWDTLILTVDLIAYTNCFKHLKN